MVYFLRPLGTVPLKEKSTMRNWIVSLISRLFSRGGGKCSLDRPLKKASP